MINSITLAGRLAADPALYNAGQDNQRCNMRIAFNEVTGRDASGQVTTTGRFIDVAVFGRSAGPCAQNLVKGQEVVVNGRITQREEGKDATGQYNRAIFSIIAAPVGGVVFGRRAGESQSNGNGAPAQQAQPVAAAQDETPPPF